jgi:hypothetical protein
MRIQPKDLAALAATYQSILTEAHDETGSAPVAQPETEPTLNQDDLKALDYVKRQIDVAIGDIGEHHHDGAYMEAAEAALEHLLQYIQQRLEEHRGELN